MAQNTKNTERELKIQTTWKFFVKYKRQEKNTKKNSCSLGVMMPLSQRSEHRGHMDAMFLLCLGSIAQAIHHAETCVPHDATGVIGAGCFVGAADAACMAPS